jgi:Tfp pilus assembly protein PilP
MLEPLGRAIFEKTKFKTMIKKTLAVFAALILLVGCENDNDENPRNFTQGVNRSRGRKLWPLRIRTQVPVTHSRC